MKKIFVILILHIFAFSVYSQSIAAYQIYNSKGKKVNSQKIMKSAREADIILFGELHNNPIAHWLQYEISYELVQNKDLIFGAEMFETDNQDELNLYLQDSINYKTLDSLARLWPNYKTDYAPLVDLAKKNKKKFIATNIPRRFAKLVYRNGFEALDSLTAEEKNGIAPLPIEYDSELPAYKNIMKAMEGHASKNLPKAQAIKDATMAYFISQNYRPGYRFIHFNGAYHSDHYQGILWYLKKDLPQLKYLTITTVLQSDVSKLSKKNKGIADFIICVDEDMTKTY